MTIIGLINQAFSYKYSSHHKDREKTTSKMIKAKLKKVDLKLQRIKNAKSTQSHKAKGMNVTRNQDSKLTSKKVKFSSVSNKEIPVKKVTSSKITK